MTSPILGETGQNGVKIDDTEQKNSENCGGKENHGIFHLWMILPALHTGPMHVTSHIRSF